MRSRSYSYCLPSIAGEAFVDSAFFLTLMRVSVAMCTYNGAAYLEEQLESLALQSFPPEELVVCDDVSTDATPQILDDFARRAPFSVRIVKNSANVGYRRNFEQAIGLCQGEVIALSDQDDFWYP